MEWNGAQTHTHTQATLEELDLMTSHVKAQDTAAAADMRTDKTEIDDAQEYIRVPLAKPDAFLYHLAHIHRFTQRCECWIFKETFCERLFDCGERVLSIDEGISALKESDIVRQVCAA